MSNIDIDNLLKDGREHPLSNERRERIKKLALEEIAVSSMSEDEFISDISPYMLDGSITNAINMRGGVAFVRECGGLEAAARRIYREHVSDTAKATARPWRRNSATITGTDYIGARREPSTSPICTITHSYRNREIDEANAELIVRAVNSFDALRQAAEVIAGKFAPTDMLGQQRHA